MFEIAQGGEQLVSAGQACWVAGGPNDPADQHFPSLFAGVSAVALQNRSDRHVHDLHLRVPHRRLQEARAQVARELGEVLRHACVTCEAARARASR